MERGRHGSGDYHFFHHHHQVLDRVSPERMPSKSSISSSLSVCPITPPLPPSCSPGASVGGGALCYIEHRISRMDTLAGVAIKYGVEVADIKRLNGLVTDLQMFALKSLQIPLPGRHPPSPILSNCLDNQGLSISEGTLPHRRHSDLFESFQSLKLNSSSQQRVSPAMSKLQGYYGLKTIDQKPASEGFEMAVYRKGGSHYLEDGPFAQPSHLSNPPISHHRKSKSVANGFLPENSDLTDDMGVTEASDIESDIWNEKLIRRRQKLEVDFHSRTTLEMLLKEDNSSGGGFSTITGKGLALRPKATSRTALGVDADANLVNPVIPLSFGDSLVAHGINGVRKSSSASSLQDQESNGIASSIWPTSKWSLKPDLQALSTAAIITRPIFDGLPKPITGRRNKTALD